MSKNAIIGVAIALCAVAAGIGSFFATRATAVRISATEPAASVSPGLVQAPSSIQPGTPASADGFVTEQPVATSPAPAVVPQAAAVLPSAALAAKQASRSGSIPATTPSRQPPATETSQAGGQGPSDSSRTGLDKPGPGGNATTQPPMPTPPPAELPADPPVTAPPPTEPLPPPEPQFEELVIAADSVLGLKLDSTVNSETARIEDLVEAHVTRDVHVGSRIAVAAGTRVLGSVSEVEAGGKMRNKARLAVRFHTLVLEDGTRAQIQTDVIFREGDSPGQAAASKMGAAAAGGAILGAILGGGKGAAIGGSIGAAGGAAAVMAGRRSSAVLPAGTAVTVRLQQPVGIMVER